MWRTFLMTGLALLLAAQAALAQPRPARGVALVIGNGTYAQQPLPGPEQDASAMAAALRQQGYSVLLHTNLDREGMRQALYDFRQRLPHGAEGLFYFAGHGMQVGRRVLLLPVDAAAARPAPLLAGALDLDAELQRMAGVASGKPLLVLLDACLDNPFRTAPSARAAPPPNTRIAYAAQPGHAAFGSAGQGWWTAALLRAFAQGGDADTLLAAAAARVLADSGGLQRPWMQPARADLALAMISLPFPALAADDASTPYRRGVLPKDSAEQYELTFWDSIKDSTHASDYEAYLQAYPNGRFAGLARARVERLKAAAPRPETGRPEAARQEAPRPAPEKAQAPRPPAKKPADSVPASAAPDASRASPAPTPATPAPAPPAARKAGGDIQDCPACPVLAAVPAGSFTMGNNNSDPSERPARRVAIDKPFAIGRTEVTVQQWNACVEAGACPRVADTQRAPNLPVGDISWDDAQAYVKWLAKASGKPYRLPTEAEWEYAARGGGASRYWWGEEMKRGMANCRECGEPWQEGAPAPVASFAANGYGLHDMS
ncbi:MAG TPA: SUMF1/EgtB/PvdO family nonheme iron enzyme, partial [Noviherbaspirillum sp.]